MWGMSVAMYLCSCPDFLAKCCWNSYKEDVQTRSFGQFGGGIMIFQLDYPDQAN